MNLDYFKGKSILILGMGREGYESLRFFVENFPKNPLGAADKSEFGDLGQKTRQILGNNPGIGRFLGRDYLKSLATFDVVVKSPGVPIHIPEIEQAIGAGKVTSQTEIFFKNCPGTLIGITGTKGKSTTSSIIFSVLKKGGMNVNLIGNIGVPMLPFLANSTHADFFVCELSAHQLYNMNVSPRISVLLNIYPEHLDYYRDMDEYIRAKANIALHQSKTDFLIYNSADPAVNEVAKHSPAQKIAFNEYDWEFKGQTSLIGKFNLDNAKIAAIIGRMLNIPDRDIEQAISDFKPLEHRLEPVGTFNGISCYNDSLSTIQESAAAAIDGLGVRVQTLVAGGFDRGQPFDKLAAAILDSKIDNLVLFPATGKKIWDEVKKLGESGGNSIRLAGLRVNFVETMGEAAQIILRDTDPGRICLLSAASASFSNFKDYSERGKAFKESLALAASELK